MESWISILLFCIVILLANIMQGITGFAGTILAMPASLMLVGYDVAKPVLNVLGILGGLYVLILNRHDVVWKELLKVCLVMLCGIIAGIFVKRFTAGKEHWLYIALGIFIIMLSVQRMIQLFLRTKPAEENKVQKKKISYVIDGIVLISAGLVHGLFVCGGPLLISYLSKTLTDRKQFRATISTVWIFLNSFILVTDIVQGCWSVHLLIILGITIPFLLAALKIGSVLYAHMNQKVFMIITYVLLFISGLSLLIK